MGSLGCGYVHIGKGDLDAWAREADIRLDLEVYDAVDGARAGRGSLNQHTPGRATVTSGLQTGSVLQMIDPKNLPRNELVPPFTS